MSEAQSNILQPEIGPADVCVFFGPTVKYELDLNTWICYLLLIFPYIPLFYIAFYSEKLHT